jgi:predicted PurR-regulated permease PerM
MKLTKGEWMKELIQEGMQELRHRFDWRWLAICATVFQLMIIVLLSMIKPAWLVILIASILAVGIASLHTVLRRGPGGLPMAVSMLKITTLIMSLLTLFAIFIKIVL